MVIRSSIDKPAGTLSKTSASTGQVFKSVAERKTVEAFRAGEQTVSGVIVQQPPTSPTFVKAQQAPKPTVNNVPFYGISPFEAQQLRARSILGAQGEARQQLAAQRIKAVQGEFISEEEKKVLRARQLALNRPAVQELGVRPEIQRPSGLSGVVLAKEFGGEIKSALPVQSEADKRIRLLGEVSEEDKSFIESIKASQGFNIPIIGRVNYPEKISSALTKYVSFEEKNIQPKLQNLFNPALKKIEEKEQQALQIIDVLRFKPPVKRKEEQLIFSEISKGTVDVLTRPRKIAKFAAIGATFVALEEGLAFGITKYTPALEFFTSPAGQFIRKGTKLGLGALFVGAEGYRVFTSPRPLRTLGQAQVETVALFGGGGLAGEGFETATVRESFFGSPARRVAEVEAIKGITGDTLAEAIRTSKTPVSAEVKGKTAIQLRTELRQASDVVAELRGKFRPEVQELTPEFLRKNLETKPSLKEAKKIILTLKQYAPDLFLKGSITQPLQGIPKEGGAGDIDLAIKERLKDAFEISAKKTKGVGFDIKEFGEARQTATAQIEPLRKVRLKIGGRVIGETRATGIIEQLSRKVEGSIRFATLQEGGQTRVKDIGDVLGLQKGIAKARQKPVFAFEKLPEGKRVEVVKPFRISAEDRVKDIFNRQKEINKLVGKRAGADPEALRRDLERSFRGEKRPRVRTFEEQPSRIPSARVISRGKTPKSFKRNLKTVSKSFSRSFSKSFSYSPNRSLSKSVSPSPSPSLPSPSPSFPPPSKPSSSITSKSISQSFSKSFSGSSSSSFSYNYLFERPSSSVGKPKIPLGLSEFGFGRPQRKLKFKAKYSPSLLGITRGIKLRGKLPKQISGFEVRGVPVGRKPISLIQVLRS